MFISMTESEVAESVGKHLERIQRKLRLEMFKMVGVAVGAVTLMIVADAAIIAATAM